MADYRNVDKNSDKIKRTVQMIRVRTVRQNLSSQKEDGRSRAGRGNGHCNMPLLSGGRRAQRPVW